MGNMFLASPRKGSYYFFLSYSDSYDNMDLAIEIFRSSSQFSLLDSHFTDD
jgi:hypothetical protein